MCSEKYLDKINEAYYSPVNADGSNVYRERVHWVCNQVTGSTVLDIGCSQGIVSLLLGREAKQVVGIDVAEESIEYAQEALLKEDKSVRGCVSFECVNMFNFSSDTLFDSVILSEVLEHLSNPEAAIEAASKLVEQNGTLVCTVPYGVNDWPDHRRTYYVFDIVRQLEEKFEVMEIQMLNRWLGLVCRPRNPESKHIDFNTRLPEFEDYFLRHERTYISTALQLRKSIRSQKKQIEQLKEKIEQIKQLQADEIEQVQQISSREADLLSQLSAANAETFQRQIAEKNTQILLYEKQVSEKEEQIRGCEKQFSETKIDIESLELQIQELKNQLYDVNRELYKKDLQLETAEGTFVHMLATLKTSVEITKKRTIEETKKLKQQLVVQSGETKKLKQQIAILKKDLLASSEENRNQQNLIKKIRKSFRYRIGEKVILTLKNPLRLLLWPYWAFGMVRSLLKKKKQKRKK